MGRVSLRLGSYFLSLCLFAGLLSAEEPKYVSGFASPESVVADEQEKFFYVSNVGANLSPTAKDADGYISKLSPAAEVIEAKFLPPEGIEMHSPKGMAIIGKRLFVADIDRLLAFDLETKALLYSCNFSSEHTSFLNDITVVDSTTLLLSATDISAVFKVSLGDKAAEFKRLEVEVPGANGLFYDAKSGLAYVAGFSGKAPSKKGALASISLSDGVYTEIAADLGLLDGLAMSKNRSSLIFSDWGWRDEPARISTVDLKTGKKLYRVNFLKELNGPADFYYSTKRGQLWVPLMKEGSILITSLDF